MKKTCFTILVACCLSLQLLAANNSTVYQQLCELNRYWLQHPISDVALQQPADFANHEALIRYHLMNVSYVLRHQATAHLSPQQLSNRNHCLDILDKYWQAGVFPKNTQHQITIPYFVDRYNTACAVGHLLRNTGQEALVQRIVRTQNNAYLAQMHYTELQQWAVDNGFQTDELAWIQPAYSPPIRIESSITAPDCGSNNGEVSSVIIDPFTQQPVTQSYLQNWYSVDGNTLGMVGSGTNHLQHLPAGLYKTEVETNAGMFSIVYDLVGVGTQGNMEINAVLQHETCYGSKDGAIQLSISGGNPPYQLRWYDQAGKLVSEAAAVGNSATLGNLSGINNGIVMYVIDVPQYTAEVTDANGCKTFGQFDLQTLYEPPYAYPSIVSPDCGAANGSIELQYLSDNTHIAWAHDATNLSNTAYNLAAGAYQVTLTNDNGCRYEQQILLSDDDLQHYLTNNVQIAPDYCQQQNGSISINGVLNATYQWSHDPTYTQANANNLSSGYYTITATTETACKSVGLFWVNAFDDIYVSRVSTTNVEAAAGVGGSAHVEAYSDYPLDYMWSTGDTTPNIQSLAAGDYTLTISSPQTGCSLSQSIRIYDEASLVSDVLSAGSNDLFAHSTITISTDAEYVHFSGSYTGNTAWQLCLYDLNGRSVAQHKALPTATTEVQISLPIAQLPAGVYVLTANNGKNAQHWKWLKQ